MKYQFTPVASLGGLASLVLGGLPDKLHIRRRTAHQRETGSTRQALCPISNVRYDQDGSDELRQSIKDLLDGKHDRKHDLAFGAWNMWYYNGEPFHLEDWLDYSLHAKHISVPN